MIHKVDENLSKETHNGRFDYKVKEDGGSTVQIETYHRNIKMSDLKEDQFNAFCFQGEYGQDHITELKKLKATIDCIRNAKTVSKNIYLKSYGSKAQFDKKMAETEYLADVTRGMLSDIFDKQETKPEDYQWIQRNLYNGYADVNHPGTQNSLLKSATADSSEISYLEGYLQAIRVCLGNRSATKQERIVLSLGRAEQAGFTITKDEVDLVEKISKMSHTIINPDSEVLLSGAEKELLGKISLNTISVRRTNYINRLRKEFKVLQRELKSGQHKQEDLELIIEALKELYFKEAKGQLWTGDDETLLIDLKRLSRDLTVGGLEQLVKNLRNQKAYNVLKGKAVIPRTPDEIQLLNKLRKNIKTYQEIPPEKNTEELTEQETAEVEKLANQYYWMKQQLWKNREYDPVGSVMQAMKNEVLSLQKLSIEFLESRREALDSSQEILLKKLKHGIPELKIGGVAMSTTEKEVRKHEIDLPHCDKIQRLEESLRSSNDIEFIKDYTVKQKHQMF
ncbi:hypothetical protein PtB15_5B405 [Puccinia triticina]|nr:hypothetical protein PtB15_5B405 [Puccinia triticina]